MCLENMIIRKKKSKIQKPNELIKDVNRFIKQCYCIVWNVEKKVKNSKNPKVVKVVCDNKTLRYIKEQETSGLLSSIGLKTPVTKISLLYDISFQRGKINEIKGKFLLAED